MGAWICAPPSFSNRRWGWLFCGYYHTGGFIRSLRDSGGRSAVSSAAGTESLIVTYPDEYLDDALHKLLLQDIGRLLVISRDAPQQLVGYLRRGAILRACQGKLDEEQVRELGWIGRLFSRRL